MPDTVLIIDDESAIAMALSVRLRAAGYDVAVASDGATGLESAATLRPDVIILDIRMPGMDGFEVNRRLKDDLELAATPVVFLSANVQEKARQQAQAGGAAAFLSKPYDPNEVLATIARVLAATPTVTGENS